MDLQSKPFLYLFFIEELNDKGTRVNLNLKELVGPFLQSESELMILICRRSVNRAERGLS